MADGMPGCLDDWRCTEPAPTEPDAPDPHEQCEIELERLEAEIAQLHARIDELEIENAALRGARS